MTKNLKSILHWLLHNGFHHAYPALFWAGLIVNWSIKIDEEAINNRSCVAVSHHYWKDEAKEIFWIAFIIRLLVFPCLIKILIRCFGENVSETINRVEVECNDGAETALFVSETIAKTKAPKLLGLVFTLPAIWPIFCCIYKFYDKQFCRGDKKAYDNFINSPKKRQRFVMMESLYNALSLGSAASFLISLLFNVFYNATHDDSYAYEEAITWALVGLCALTGVGSVFTPKFYKMMCYSEVFITTFYYSFDVIVSSADCMHPSSFTRDHFNNRGLYIVVVSAIFSLGVSIAGGFHGLEDVYKTEQVEDEVELPGLGCPNAEAQ